jgi:murein DD-endopeptidase MepM/ murein hydrolase activator NlpD
MDGMARFAAVVALLLAAAPATARVRPGWGADLDPAAGGRLVALVRPELAAIVKAAPEKRAALAKAFVSDKGEGACEAWKRFRNPELKPLFRELLVHPEWKVVHRAMLVLEQVEGPDFLASAWDHLFHSEPRIRERATLACLRLWDAKRGAPLSKGDGRNAIATGIPLEPDPHARAALEALLLRMDGKLAPETTGEECIVPLEDGLRWVPLLRGWQDLGKVAPGWKPAAASKQGGGKLPPPGRWTTPLLGWGKEEVAGAGLQPFANPREGGRVHTGLDAGAALDGAGVYAASDGIVRLVHAGGDMGTMLVLEHALPDGGSACAVYMHLSGTLWVRSGERVAAGRLLGSLGLSYSPENGGHFAHLHYGLYPGPFRMDHNYGYKRAADGLSDWLDPASRLPLWADMAGPGAGEKEEAEALVARASRLRKAGHPARAKAVLAAGRSAASSEALAAWGRDPAFAAALVAEKKVQSAEEQAERLASKKDGAAQAKAALEKVAEEVRGTELEARVRETLARM